MEVEICIIGAGIVGIALARELSLAGREVVVVEKNRQFGMETSSHNSEVIHSGIYYNPDSLKAKLCVEGNKLMYDYCRANDLPYKPCGKLIVATEKEDVHKLMALQKNGIKNGVEGVRLIGKEEISDLEAHIYAVKALHVPSTGIVDSHSLMKRMLDEAINQGASIAYLSEVIEIRKAPATYQVKVAQGDGNDFSFKARWLINAAGLESSRIAKMLGIYRENEQTYFCKGEYFGVHPPKNRLLKRLIYPLPFKNLLGLGVHATIDLDGSFKLGPNAYYLKKNEYDYTVDSTHKDDFYRAVKGYLPFLEKKDLYPEMAGLRPKIQGPGEAVRDFVIREESEMDFPGFINLLGIESPGLTSCMAIAKHVTNHIISQDHSKN